MISFGEFQNLNEAVSATQAKGLEDYLDAVFEKFNMGVEFSKHFIDSIKKEKSVTVGELRDTFRNCARKFGKELSALKKDDGGQLRQLSTKLNVPFMISKSGDELDLVAINAMHGDRTFKNGKKYEV